MNISAETLRMSEIKFQHAKEDIIEEFRKQRSLLTLQWTTASRLDRETAKIVPFLLRKMGEALVNIYLESFDLEDRIPEQSDAVELDRKIELLFARDHGLVLVGLPLGGEVQAVEQRIIQHLHARVQEMRLRAKRKRDSMITTNIQSVTGGVQIGSNVTLP